MAKLKSFEEYIADIDSAEEIEQAEVDMGEPSVATDDDELTSNDQEKGGTEIHGMERGEEVGIEPEDMEEPLETGEEEEHINGEVIDSEPEDKSAEIEDQMEDPSDDDEDDDDDDDIDESTVTEDSDEDDDDDDDDEDDDDEDEDDDEDDDDEEESEESEEDSEVSSEEPSKSVESILKEAYEACKNEAKAWEADMHDEHTIESYLKENAALVATLAMNALKEMKEDMTLEMYEAHCNELKEAYAKKMDELKEAWGAEGEE